MRTRRIFQSRSRAEGAIAFAFRGIAFTIVFSSILRDVRIFKANKFLVALWSFLYGSAISIEVYLLHAFRKFVF